MRIIHIGSMTSPAVSLGNGAWGAKNNSMSNLTNQEINAYYEQNISCYLPPEYWSNTYCLKGKGSLTYVNPLDGSSYGNASIFLDGISGSSSALQAIAGQSENYAISWGSYLRIDEGNKNILFQDQNENALITIYQANDDGSYKNLSGLPQVFPAGVSVQADDVLFLDVLLYVDEAPEDDVNIQWSVQGDGSYVDLPADQLFLTYDYAYKSVAGQATITVQEPTGSDDKSGSIPVYASSDVISAVNISSSNQSGLADSTYLVDAAYLDSDGGTTPNKDLKFVSPSGLDISPASGSQWQVPLSWSQESLTSDGFNYWEGGLNVEVNSDSYAELDETLSLAIESSPNYQSVNQKFDALVIPANGPRASLLASQSATEGGYGWFDVNLSEPSKGKYQIPYSIASNSTADLGTDYLAPLSVVNTKKYSSNPFLYFNSGKTTSGLYVTALQDQIDEPTETVEIELKNQPITTAGYEYAGYLVDSYPSATLEILDSGLCPAEVLILSPDRNGATVIRAQEQAGSQQATIRVQLNSEPRENVTISLSSTSGDLAEQSLTFTSKNWASGQSVAVSDLSDSAVTTVTATASSGDSLYNGLSTTQTIVPSDWQEDLIVSLTEGGSQVSSLPSLSVSAVDSSEDNSSGFGFVIKTNRVDHQNDLEIVYQLSTSDPTFQFGGTGLSLYRLFDYNPSSGVIGLNTENDDFDYFSVIIPV